jgi:hypothetical protein
MNSDEIQTFFGWCTAINFGLLILTSIILIPFQGKIAKLHSWLMNIDEQELPRIYMNYLANYKLGIFLFSLVPYIALKIMD